MKRLSTKEVRDAQRQELKNLNYPHVTLPNPSADPPLDRMRNQPYEAKIQSLGMAPNLPRHFYELLKGDSGAGSSIYRRASMFQQLAPVGGRTASTEYTKAIQIATMRSSDQRPRYWQASLLGVGRVIESAVPIQPLSDDEILRFSPGIFQDVVIPLPTNAARGVPLISTTKFRIMVHDESGQRFFDVDCLGARNVNVYAWGVTVFALIKEEGYEIDREQEQESLSGMLDQSIMGARVIPIRTNFTQNPQNRTVTIDQPLQETAFVLPIPPGSKRVQVYCNDGRARFNEYAVQFINVDPVNPGASGAVGFAGVIEPDPGVAYSTIYRIPNSNAISFSRLGINPALWTVVFEETP